MVAAGTTLLLTPEGSAAAEPPRAPGSPAGPPAPATQGPGKHAVAPLPFNPAKLKGLSEKLLRSHHENNYGGAVKNLNKVEEELARVTKDTPGFLVGGLKERELTFTNSMILHEAYFGNLGGDGKASGPIQKLLAAAHGDFGRWEEHFRATGASLGGGSGWVILTYNFHSGQPQTYWSGNHTQALAHGHPLLVMDMYEHAYQMDYGAAAARYIDAFFQNVSWDVVNARLERAQKAATVLRG
ncbi:superoxide dismutase [Pyxidicoccus fallax]|uniref:superoxide dismutase n=1 Tax=Pyxidicoccus fallax TaxID=394095 RepID=A0A848LXK8_9BACT|nr:superoxide dismutase [Pyxidicoccus fallax]NPC85831.1 superoxide dismutase [Pyxidicoccus fallax]